MNKTLKQINSFDEIISPISKDLFYKKHHDNQHLHISTSKSKDFSNVFSWNDLNYLLNMTTVWTSDSLNLVLNKKKIPPEEYCQVSIGRNGSEVYQPDRDKIKNWLEKGSTLIANDVDALNPAISSIANIFENELSAKAQCNIYFSIKGHQGFDIHFDMHEVFALHIIGEKKWKLYENRLDKPINNQQFSNMLDPEFCRNNCGKVADEIIMKPGDVLYIPRGQYHEALASSDSSLHLTFGITHIIGHDFLSLIYEKAMTDSAFRSNLPLTRDGKEKRTQWINSLTEKLSKIAKDNNIASKLENLSENFKYKRGGYNFPNDFSSKSKSNLYIVSSEKISITQKKGSLYLQDAKQAIKIPDKLEKIVTWTFKKQRFFIEDLTSQFPNLTKEEIIKFINDMENMKVLIKE